MKSYRILIAEDEVLAALSLKIEFESLGHNVVGIVKDESSAIAACEAHEIDVAVLDVNLGSGSKGIEIGKTIQQRFGTPVLLMTGYEIETLESATSSLTVIGYGKKPVFAQDLLRDIDRYFDQKKTDSR